MVPSETHAVTQKCTSAPAWTVSQGVNSEWHFSFFDLTDSASKRGPTWEATAKALSDCIY